MHYLLMYDYVPDILERRGPFRSEHLRLAWAANEQGMLVLAGALAEPVDGAVFIFECESESQVREFAANDPYVKHGLVTQWRVRPWTTVVGEDAKTPLFPS
jgi:uncharacterized protein YciI